MVIKEPRVVEGHRGFAWWAEGWRIFTASPGKWIAVIVVYTVVSVLIGLVPVVGTVGHSLLTPVFVGGLMVGCRALERGEPLRISHLFEGFQAPHFVPLMIIGAINIALVLVFVLLSATGVVGSMGLADLSALSNPADPFGTSLPAVGLTEVFVFLLALVLAAVFTMLNWFAPALVALRGLSALDAMKLSFMACLRNWFAFLVYGLIVMVAGVVATIAVVVLAFVFGAGAIMSGAGMSGGIGAFLGFFLLIAAMVALAVAIVGPIAVGSIYAGFKDTVEDPDATVTHPAYL